jgi:hypothetical protein
MDLPLVRGLLHGQTIRNPLGGELIGFLAL